MKKIMFLFLITSMFYSLFSIAVAQVELKTKQDIVEDELRVYGLTQEKLGKLKKIELDVVSILQNKKPYDEKFLTVFSDLVVIGKVIEIKKTPAPRAYPFHSVALFKVDQIINCNKTSITIGDTIQILRESGPITDQEGAEIKVSSDLPIRLGETLIAFMQQPEKNSYMRHRFKEFFSIKNISIPNSYYLDSFFCFKINHDEINILGVKKRLKDVIFEINKTAKTLIE